jgi:hypothetical protein
VTANTEITLMMILPTQLSQLTYNCQLHFNQAFMHVLAERLRFVDDRIAKLLS